MSEGTLETILRVQFERYGGELWISPDIQIRGDKVMDIGSCSHGTACMAAVGDYLERQGINVIYQIDERSDIFYNPASYGQFNAGIENGLPSVGKYDKYLAIGIDYMDDPGYYKLVLWRPLSDGSFSGTLIQKFASVLGAYSYALGAIDAIRSSEGARDIHIELYMSPGFPQEDAVGFNDGAEWIKKHFDSLMARGIFGH